MKSYLLNRYDDGLEYIRSRARKSGIEIFITTGIRFRWKYPNTIIRNEVKKDCRGKKIFIALLDRNFVLSFGILFASEAGTWKKAFT